MRIETCCSASAQAKSSGFDEDEPGDGGQLRWGRREVQIAYLGSVSNHACATQAKHNSRRPEPLHIISKRPLGTAPSLPADPH